MPVLTDEGYIEEPTYYFHVTQTPKGEAPYDIRLQWLDMFLPVMARVLAEADVLVAAVEIFSREAVTVVNGVEVDRLDAICALESAGRQEAADFWSQQCADDLLVFDPHEGEICLWGPGAASERD